jgi:D-amino-acid oxidase
VTSPTIDATVVGSGVLGLTTATTLAEAGLRVRILTADPPSGTTSAAAGAMWGPYLVEPLDKVLAWSRLTLDKLQSLALDRTTGVRIVAGVEASRRSADIPAWGHLLPGFRGCDRGELPAGFDQGFRFSVPLVDMPVYLGYLSERFRSYGGEVDMRKLSSLQEVMFEAPITVNCSGVGARALVPDEGLRPIRGQLVVVANPGIDEFFSEDTGPSPDLLHIYPHGDTVVLGGVAEDDGSWNLEPDMRTAKQIVDRCAAVEPRLRGARILGHRVGLRPTRSKVRCEEEAVADEGVRLFHNYGHGGAGLSLSWGCAEEIAHAIVLARSEGGPGSPGSAL